MIYKRIDEEDGYFRYLEIKDGKGQYFGNPYKMSKYRSTSWNEHNKPWEKYIPTDLTREEAEFIYYL